MNPRRLLAAAMAATGLFLAFPPGMAGANDITAASVDCQQWTASWAHFPEGQNVRLDVELSYPSGTTATGHAFTYGEADGTASGPAPSEETGEVTVLVRWHLATDHTASRTVTIACTPEPTTTTSTTTVPPVVVPPTVATAPPPAPPVAAPSLPVGTPELAFTGGAPWGKIAIGAMAVLAGCGLIVFGRRRV